MDYPIVDTPSPRGQANSSAAVAPREQSFDEPIRRSFRSAGVVGSEGAVGTISQAIDREPMPVTVDLDERLRRRELIRKAIERHGGRLSDGALAAIVAALRQSMVLPAGGAL